MDDILKHVTTEANGVIGKTREELAGIRTGRASALLVENIMVECYDSKMPLKQLGSISVGGKEIAISVWDISVAQAAAKAIEDAGLGVTPQVDGNTIRINLPPLTLERRKELSKLAGRVVEEYKIRLRHIRDEANKRTADLKSEDERFKAKEKIQEKISAATKELETMLEHKVTEINE